MALTLHSAHISYHSQEIGTGVKDYETSFRMKTLSREPTICGITDMLKSRRSLSDDGIERRHVFKDRS